jgi:hypothetical protein
LILKVFIKTPPVFFALPHALPFCNFFRHAFCTLALAAHCFLAFGVSYYHKVKAKKQRAAPTLQTKRHARKNYPKLY